MQILTDVFFSDGQLDILPNNRPKRLHIDSTSNVCAKADGKTIHYYSAVIPGWEKSTPPTPLFSGLLTECTNLEIRIWLHSYLAAFAKRRGKAFLPQEIVTDFSLALIYAVINTFSLGANTLDEYLQKCWDILNDKDAPDDKKMSKESVGNFVHLYLCACHVKKNICNKAKSLFPNSKISERKKVKQYFDLLQNSTDLESYFTIFEHYCSLLVCRDEKDPMLVEALRFFENKEDSTYFDSEITESDKQKLKEDGCSYHKKKSPFYKKAKEILEKVQSNILPSAGPVTNRFHNPGYANYLMDYYVPFAPLWSGLMFNFERHLSYFEGTPSDVTQFRASNANIETFWNSQKTLIIQSKTQHPGVLLRNIIDSDKHRIEMRTTLEGKENKRPRKQNKRKPESETPGAPDPPHKPTSRAKKAKTFGSEYNPSDTFKKRKYDRSKKPERFINKSLVGTFIPHGGDRWNEPGSDFPDTTDITDGLPLQIGPFQQELED